MMRREVCLCHQIPALDLDTRVVIVVSHGEVRAPTNTGRLAALALINSALLIRGAPGTVVPLREHLLPDRPSLLLYPDPSAAELTPEFVAGLGGPCNLVVPDGNWRQAAKMRRREPAMAELPIVRIRPGRPSAYQVRRETKPDGLATIEAIAYALAVLEGEETAGSLLTLLGAMVRSTLASRGALPPPV